MSLSPTGCAARRERLLKLLERLRLDAAVVRDVRDVYYFSGALFPPDFPVALAIGADGDALLVAPSGDQPIPGVALTEYPWNHRGTRDPNLAETAGHALRQALAGKRYRAVGIQGSSLLDRFREAVLGSGDAKVEAIDEPIAACQRRKDADELDVIRGDSIRANFGAYAAVQEAIHPGATELDILAAGYRGAMDAAGEKVFHDGDYQSGAYNGPARHRRIDAGELYIVDAWTCYRGYWSDMSRTFFVGSGPSEEQVALFDHVRRVLHAAGSLLRPGVDGQDVYRALDEMLREHPPLAAEGLIHHGGHAIGLRSHEMPDVNLGRGGALEPGNVICIEPGGYFAAARYGVRLENMFLITADGCEDLCPGEIELHDCG